MTKVFEVLDAQQSQEYDLWTPPVMKDKAINADEIDKKKQESMVEIEETIDENQDIFSEEVTEEDSLQIQLPSPEELEAIHEEARKEGFQKGKNEGYQEGLQQAQKEFTLMAKQCEDLLSALSSPLDDFDDMAEYQLVKLSSAIAKKIIQRELYVEPERIVEIVKEAVKLLPSYCQHIDVFLHPDDAKILRQVFHLENSNHKKWQIFEDPAQVRGNCRLIADNSLIDFDIDKQVCRVTDKLLEDLEHIKEQLNADNREESSHHDEQPSNQQSPPF